MPSICPPCPPSADRWSSYLTLVLSCSVDTALVPTTLKGYVRENNEIFQALELFVEVVHAGVVDAFRICSQIAR